MVLSGGKAEIVEKKEGGVLVIALRGRLDAISSPAVEAAILSKIESGEDKIVLNFSGVKYLSSAGMRMLLSMTKKLKACSGKLVLCAVSTNVLDLLKMSGFDHVTEIFSSESDALKRM